MSGEVNEHTQFISFEELIKEVKASKKEDEINNKHK